MLKIQVLDHEVLIGERFAVSFQRTLRVPEDSTGYPLPPGLGTFPVHRVEDHAATVPTNWLERGGVFIPMYQREALWLGFSAAAWKPNAVKVGVGGINAVSGEEWQDKQGWSDALNSDPQDYIVCPDQPWLDGINSGEGVVRQFVAMPLGAGYTVEEQLTGSATFGGIQIIVFEPKPGVFPDQPPRRDLSSIPSLVYESAAMPDQDSEGLEMGLAAGGSIRQKIYPDPYGPATWDLSVYGALQVHIVNSLQYQAITGRPPLPSPISARTYTTYGFPWFELYDEEASSLAGPERLKGLRGTDQHDENAGGQEGEPIEIQPEQVKKLRHKHRKGKEGK